MGLLDSLLGGDDNDLQEGDWVEVLTTGDEGEIVSIDGDEYEVSIDGEGETEFFTRDELRKI